MQFLSLFQNRQKKTAFTVDTLAEMINQIDHHGYAVIKLMDTATDQLYFEESCGILTKTEALEDFDGFLSVGRINNSELRTASKNSNIKYLNHAVQQFFEEKYDVITGMHLFKKKGKKGILNPHQDSSLTDERKFDSYFLWYPIQGADEQTGTLEVIPYSHKLPIYQRSLNIRWPLHRFEKELWKLMQPVNVRPGEAIVMHSRMIHGSGVNKKDTVRMASNLFLKPKAAPFLHYYAEEPDAVSVETFHVDEYFYSNHNILQKPEGYAIYAVEKNTNPVYNRFSDIQNALKFISK